MLNDCLETWWNWLYVTNRDTFPDHQTSWGNIYITFLHDKNLFKNFCLIIYKKTNGFWGKVNIFFPVYRWHYMIRCHYLLCRRNTHDSILWWNEIYQLYMSHPTLSLSWLSYLIWEISLHHFQQYLSYTWLSVLFVEETGVPGKKHWPVASHWHTLLHNAVLSTPHQTRIRTHNVSGDRYWLHR